MIKTITVDGNTIPISEELYNQIVEEADKSYYNSSTHGLVKISEMDDNHLRNSILKRIRELVADKTVELRQLDLEDMMDVITEDFTFEEDTTLSALVTEALDRCE